MLEVSETYTAAGKPRRSRESASRVAPPASHAVAENNEGTEQSFKSEKWKVDYIPLTSQHTGWKDITSL